MKGEYNEVDWDFISNKERKKKVLDGVMKG